MKRLMDDGFWQQDFGGTVHVFYPPAKAEDDH